MTSQKRILVAPLDWGLGHVTRCMPIIEALLKRGHQVILASDGRSWSLLQKEYPNLKLLRTPAYNITYNSPNMILNMALQMPKIILAMNRERRWIRSIVAEENIDLLISDNRYGLYLPKLPSIFLTHQLHIKIPLKPLQWIVNRQNHKLIARYDQCWVPDFSGDKNISGELSHGQKAPSNVRYIGPLSRMKRMETTKKYDIIAVLSGPEPQRTILEKKLYAELKETGLKSLIVQGKPDQKYCSRTDENLIIIPYMTSSQLNEAIAESDVMITRSGYSTIMDLVKMNKKAILIPTPGQTEQEYLAELFHKNSYFLRQNQDCLDIKQALNELSQFKGFPLGDSEELLEQAIKTLE